MKKYLLAGVALGSLWSASALSLDLSILAKPSVVPSWNGWYSGTQFGMDCINASHDSASTSNSSSNSQSTSISPQITTTTSSTGTSSSFISGSFTSTTSSTSTSSSVGSSTAQGRNCGGKLGLYGGYNLMWGNNAVLGAQLEGGVANVRVNMTSIGNSISNFSSTSTSTSITVGPGAAVTTTTSPPSTSPTLSNSTGIDTL
jgi:hypothetical protein